MTLRILHTSDLHGDLRPLLDAPDDFDVWVDTGDFFPTAGRRFGCPIDSRREYLHQQRWWGYGKIGAKLGAKLAGRPALIVPGNHDYQFLAVNLQRAGENAYNVPLYKQAVEVCGVRFAGFREVPWIAGEWNGEVKDESAVVGCVLDAHPDVLLTHAPPRGILDGSDQEHYGFPYLRQQLDCGPTGLRVHLFGHVHEHGGEGLVEGGIHYYNGATTARIIEVSL